MRDVFKRFRGAVRHETAKALILANEIKFLRKIKASIQHNVIWWY